MLGLEKDFERRRQKWNFATNSIDCVLVLFYDQVLFP